MKILSDHNIQNSLKINSKCRFFIEINDISEFVDLYTFIKDQNLPVLILGEGTNIVSKDYFDGIVVKPKFDNIN